MCGKNFCFMLYESERVLIFSYYLGLACKPRTFFRSSLNSLPPKNNVCEHERQNDFCDVKRLFWCSPIRSKVRMQFERLIATSCAGLCWILGRVTKYNLELRLRKQPFLLAPRRWGRLFSQANLEREFHNYNEVSCDVECWLLCQATAS